ncbi:hypothetical protein ABT404_04640 [Streptomyces hyaluromycini]|uniref:Uncharacterized protein n=1 Tax=Streptomyces hyaluromycini TaxID=1377993 RepID=A0ABV1WPH2_9ACTN
MIVAIETTGAERTGLVVELSLRDRIRAGDPEAFAELFGAHAQAVYGHAATAGQTPQWQGPRL